MLSDLTTSSLHCLWGLFEFISASDDVLVLTFSSFEAELERDVFDVQFDVERLEDEVEVDLDEAWWRLEQ